MEPLGFPISVRKDHALVVGEQRLNVSPGHLELDEQGVHPVWSPGSAQA